MTNSSLDYIHDLVRKVKTIDLAKSHIHHVRARLKHAINEEARLGELLNDKYETVEKLKSSSIPRLFKSILGSKEDEIEMERQEYLQVVLQYNDARKSIELFEFELEVLKNQITQETEIKEKLEEAIRLHRADIFKAYPKIADRVNTIQDDIKAQVANQKELEEALEVGTQLIESLAAIIKNLKHASDWGDWEDNQLSRRLEVQAKNLFVDKAMALVYKTQMLFVKFDKELEDIHDHKKIVGTYHFQDFGNFSKVYYNRLVADWVIQKQIKNTLSNVENVKDSVLLINNTLKHEIHQANEEIIIKGGEIKELIKLSIDNF